MRLPFLSQIERGERRMPLDLARHVDAKLGRDGFFERRCEDARRARQSGYAEYFADVAEMEPFAETIEDWAPMLVPGLLQTPAYARAISRAAMPRAADETIETLVAARMGRAKLFDGECPPDFWAVLDESVLRRPAFPRRRWRSCWSTSRPWSAGPGPFCRSSRKRPLRTPS